MSLLQDLLALKQPVAENQDEWEAAHAAQAEEFHSAQVHDGTYNELAQSDEFSVQLDDDDTVNLLDGEMTVRASMPYRVWLELCQETVHKHVVRHAPKGGDEDR